VDFENQTFSQNPAVDVISSIDKTPPTEVGLSPTKEVVPLPVDPSFIPVVLFEQIDESIVPSVEPPLEEIQFQQEVELPIESSEELLLPLRVDPDHYVRMKYIGGLSFPFCEFLIALLYIYVWPHLWK
jgi:hypothetical protein